MEVSIEQLKWNGLKNPYRVRQLIKKAIKRNNLDLTGLTVFTETASNYYVVTPIIAAMAGAKVYAITDDSKYANKEVVKCFTYEFAEFCGVRDKIEVIYEKDKMYVSKSNIVTNLGFVRPIDKEFINMMNDKAVVPLMFEAWEYREGDIDLRYCESKGIPVMATSEGEIFDFCGPLCAKMLFDADIEVLSSKIAIISDDAYGYAIKSYIEKMGGKADIIDSILGLDLSYDALVIAKYSSKELKIPFSERISVVKFASNFRMEKTLADLGPKPIIDLNCAGLKVGEVMARARLKGLTIEQIELNTLKYSPAQVLLLRGIK